MSTNAALRRSLMSDHTITSVLNLAKSDPRLVRTADEFDRDPWLLNTPYGTVELKTGHMREHRRGDFITKITAVAPSPATVPLLDACPRFLKFLDEITGGDRELAGFLQRTAGYALTGSIQEQCLFFLYGTGANGKSVFLEALSGILDGYHTVAPIETFTESPVDRHPTELAALRGSRFVTAIETAEGRHWNETRIKTLTGGDKIAARFMRQDYFEFVPQFKLIVAGNHRPSLRTVDEAIRRRIYLVPFTMTFPSEQRDKDLPTKLKSEWPGILRWAIEGCLAWQHDGLKPPDTVRKATAEYLLDEDDLGLWIEDRCERDPNAWEASGKLYQSWCRWAKATNIREGSQRSFAQKLEAHFKPHRGTGGTRGFKGIKLKQEETEW
jgi:putative DNA primase/helicase